jgi:hypothetical protein
MKEILRELKLIEEIFKAQSKTVESYPPMLNKDNEGVAGSLFYDIYIDSDIFLFDHDEHFKVYRKDFATAVRTTYLRNELQIIAMKVIELQQYYEKNLSKTGKVYKKNKGQGVNALVYVYKGMIQRIHIGDYDDEFSRQKLYSNSKLNEFLKKTIEWIVLFK